MAITKASSVINAASDSTIRHIPKFGGEIWFVDGAAGLDTNTGNSPDNAFLTIGAAITAMSAGDAITVRAATYTEVGLDLDEDNAEVWFEIGTILDPVSGTALTVSGNRCRLLGPVEVTPAAAAIGVLVSGAGCQLEDFKVLAGGTGISVTGSGAVLRRCACGLQTTIAFDLKAAQARLEDCSTVGVGATTGFGISNNADIGVLKGCTSAGHTTAGYSIASGSTSWTLLDCSSGAGDGRLVNDGGDNAISNFTFDDDVAHTLTFDGSGGTSENLFKITGTVLITKLYGHVDTALSADIGNGFLELDDGTNQVDITDSPGPSHASLPVGTFLHKIDDATVAIKIEDSSQVRLYEDASKFGQDPNFQVTAKAGADTYIRFTYSDVGTSGVIHWHAQWRPLSDEGFVESV